MIETSEVRVDLGDDGVLSVPYVNVVGEAGDGPHLTAQWDSYGEEGQRALVERIATRRTGQPYDIARGVLFFVAPDAGWVSGQTISIDGGHSLF